MRKRLLFIAEDNEDHAFLINRSLLASEENIDVKWAKDGQEIIDLIKNESQIPDLVLLDLKMPKKDGFEVLSFLKGNVETTKIPVLVLSTSNNEKDVHKAYQLGANCYITKPMEISKFRSKLSDIPKFWFHTTTLPSFSDEI